jgi:hypothetical protein
MKQLIKVDIKSFLLFVIVCFYQTIAMAQDSIATSSSSHRTTTTTTTSTTPDSNWYSQPWVWIVAGIIFIIVLVALLKGNSSGTSSSDKVTVTKTVRRDTE